MWQMRFTCPECESIYREFSEALRSIPATQPATDLANWLERLTELAGESAQIRETSPLWAAWRHQRQHRVLTGHYAPMIISPGNIANN
jgi:hypothetical protein